MKELTQSRFAPILSPKKALGKKLDAVRKTPANTLSQAVFYERNMTPNVQDQPYSPRKTTHPLFFLKKLGGRKKTNTNARRLGPTSFLQRMETKHIQIKSTHNNIPYSDLHMNNVTSSLLCHTWVKGGLKNVDGVDPHRDQHGENPKR